MPKHPVIRAATAALVTAAGLAAQWGPVTTPNTPSARSGAMMAFDVQQNRMLMFGGNATNELWSFANGTWTQLAPAVTPGPRHRSAMAADSIAGSIVLYGGIDASGGQSQLALDDTWTWTGSNWQQQTPVTTPGGRARHAMVYDLVRQVTVLFGGRLNL